MSAYLLRLALSDAALDELDGDGRPLGEQSSPARYRAAGVDERPCPFDDRRAQTGKPINAAALRQVSSCWPEVIALLQRLSALQSAPGDDAHGNLSGHHVWRAHLGAMLLPTLWRAAHPTKPVPRALSATFKLSLGYSIALPLMLLSQPGVAESPLIEALDDKDFFALCDMQSWLIGQTQVCAGSARMIAQSYEAMCRVTRDTQPALPCVERVDLPALTLAMAGAQRDMLCAALLTRDRMHSGELRLEGMHQPPHARDMSGWPLTAQLASSPRPLRPFALVAAMPNLQQAMLDRLFHTSAAPQTDALLMDEPDALLQRAVTRLHHALHIPGEAPAASSVFMSRTPPNILKLSI